MYSLLQLNAKYIKEDEEIPLPAETVDGDLTLNEVQVIYLQCIAVSYTHLTLPTSDLV